MIIVSTLVFSHHAIRLTSYILHFPQLINYFFFPKNLLLKNPFNALVLSSLPRNIPEKLVHKHGCKTLQK
jgi:hypothetical protein